MSYLKALHRAAVSVATFIVMTFGTYAAPTPEPAKTLPSIDAILNHIRLDFLFAAQGSNSSVSGNQVYASPDGSGGQLLMRSLVLGDLPRGTAGQCITGNGAGSAPSYSACAGASGVTTTAGATFGAFTYDFTSSTLTMPTGFFQTRGIANSTQTGLNLINDTTVGGVTVTNTTGNSVSGALSNLYAPAGSTQVLAGLFSGGLQSDIVQLDSSLRIVNKTPGVSLRTDSTATPATSCAAGGDRGQGILLTNAANPVATTPQAGVTCLSNFFTTFWGTGAGGFTLKATTSAINGIAGATGIPYPGNTWVNLVSNNTDYVAWAARAVKGGTNITEVLNADGTVTFNAAAASNARIDQITSATSTPTAPASGNFKQEWDWAQTTDSQAAFTFGETLAATGGTIAATGLANQSELKASTATNSTASPLYAAQGSITNTVATPALGVGATWNNGSLLARLIVGSVINTSSASGVGSSRLISLQAGAAGATDEFWVDVNGGGYFNNAIRFPSGTAIQGSASNQNITFMGGQDAANAASSGTATYRTADNSLSTAATAAGSTTVRGGDETAATANATVAGALIERGGNVASTSTTATPGAASLTGGGFTGAATNGVGADVTIAGGLGTGNATPSHVFVKSPGFGAASGSTAQTQVTRFVVHAKAGSTTTATATNMFNVALANNQTAGVRVHVHVETTQATPHNCSSSSEFFVVAQDTAGTITTNVSSAVGAATICSTGTLTLTLAASAAAPTVISVTPSWTTIVPSAVIITVGIENLSQQDVALL